MNKARELVVRLRGFQKGDYVKVEIPKLKTPIYGEIIEVINEYCWLHERLEKYLVIKTKEGNIMGINLDDKDFKVRPARRRK